MKSRRKLYLQNTKWLFKNSKRSIFNLKYSESHNTGINNKFNSRLDTKYRYIFWVEYLEKVSTTPWTNKYIVWKVLADWKNLYQIWKKSFNMSSNSVNKSVYIPKHDMISDSCDNNRLNSIENWNFKKLNKLLSNSKCNKHTSCFTADRLCKNNIFVNSYNDNLLSIK